MLLGLLVVYCPPQVLDGSGSLLGVDYNNIHARRIAYAQEALSDPAPHLPAWHTRELFGSPFWSNVQSFPFLPTRLVLLGLDPSSLYSVAVILAAALAALFTFLFCRKLGLGLLASAASGWTFSASGFFASRVLLGHLPLLEAYPALPLLLWIVECIARADPMARNRRFLHLSLALAVFCVALAGHPQIPVYAIGSAALYALVRLRGRRALAALASVAAGLGLAGFAWWPMLRLIGRSSRVLSLDRAENDIALPLWRLKSFLFPWADGWPALVDRLPAKSFVDPVRANFWDTVGYVGWIPVLAVLALLVRSLVLRRRPSSPWLFVAAIAGGGLLLALPFARDSFGLSGWTLLRSPSRLLYLTTFGFSAALGALVDLLLAARTRRAVFAALGAVLLLVHAADLAVHDGYFVRCIERTPAPRAEIEAARRELGDRRAAIDFSVYVPENRRVDDVGFFDSIMLARPYRAITAMAGLPEGCNVQTFDGNALPGKALAELGVARVVTLQERDDLTFVSEVIGANVYAVPDPAPRAAFVYDARVRFAGDEEILAGLRAGSVDLRRTMALAPDARPPGFLNEGGVLPPDVEVVYERPDSDHVVLRVAAPAFGFFRVLESFDEGWSATLDGGRVPILAADTFAMAVRVPGGDHEVRLEYKTPGARAGWILTAVSALLLAGFLLGSSRRAQ
jgi:hypothetical protein